jgi:hypothetical protein
MTSVEEIQRPLPSPLQVIISSSLLSCLIGILFHHLELFHHSGYFSFGPPVELFGKTIETQYEFWLLICCFMANKAMSALVTEIVYNWIVNNIHDPKSCSTGGYSKQMSLFIMILNSVHLSINSMFSINGAKSQISFLIVEMIGNLSVIIYVNNRYIQRVLRNSGSGGSGSGSDNKDGYVAIV